MTNEEKKKTSALPVALLLLLVAGGILASGWFGYSFYTRKKQEKAQRIVEEQKKAEIEKAVLGLLKEATSLSDDKKHEEALAKVEEALKQNPKHEEARKMQAKVSTAIDLEQLIPVKKLAEVRWAAAKNLVPGQGFEALLKAVEGMFSESESLYNAKDYKNAKTKYQAVAAECERLMSVDSDRQLARGARDESDKAQEAAKQAKAEDEAKQMWADAIAKDKEATASFENGEFVKASEAWKVAAKTFADAAVFASGTLAVRAVEKTYNEVLATAKNGILEAFGGQKWVQTKAIADAGRQLAAGQKWAEAVAAWTAATAALKDAIKTAVVEEARDRMQKSYKAAMTGVEATLTECQGARKNDKKKIPLLQAAIETLDQVRTNADYGLLTADDHKALDKTLMALHCEKFYFRFPDLVQIDQPVAVSLTGLGAGCSEAITAQQKAVAEMDGFVEVKTRKAGIVLRLIPAGTFTMGKSPRDDADRDEMPRHKVVLKRPFYMATCEITQDQWVKISRKDNPSHFTTKNSGSLPVDSVTFDKAAAFCDWLCDEEGVPHGTYRLPTEAEWEYACRAGVETTFYTGNNDADLLRAGWFQINSGKAPHPVGQKAPNAFGLYDMHGNVWEWCSDGARAFTAAEVTDPTGPTDGFTMVTRGGAWNDAADRCRSANRGWARKRNLQSYDLGLRVIRVLPEEVPAKE